MVKGRAELGHLSYYRRVRLCIYMHHCYITSMVLFIGQYCNNISFLGP